ncbi:MAG: YbjN domain-containing protein [Lachnospiraceae bacterium]|nr:YbjN domain-containing protein [Lachnospiraceae bacterium]
MANMAAKVVGAYFDAKGVKYEVIDEDGAVLKLGFSMDNRDGIRLIVRFDSDSEGVSVKAYDLAKFQEDKKQKMFEVCNKLNAQYRWVKFYVDESDNTITVEEDAVIQLDSCGEEVYQCCFQVVAIADEAYPEIMRAIFA